MATTTETTVREQRSQLFDVQDQDGPSPYRLVEIESGAVMPEATAREQRSLLYEYEEQDEASPYRLEAVSGPTVQADVAGLRSYSEVYQLIEDAADEDRHDLAARIKGQRPDLAEMVDQTMELVHL